MLTSISDFTLQLAHGARQTPSGWLSFNAPCCHHNGEGRDTKRRGGIHANPDGSITFKCFNCAYTTYFQPGRNLSYKYRKLLSWMGADENEVRRLTISALRMRELIGTDIPVEQVIITKVEFPEFLLPDTFADVKTLALSDIVQTNPPPPLLNALEYIDARGISICSDTADDYPFYLTDTKAHNLHKRIIIPFYWDGKLVGYTARAMVPDISPKYHNNYAQNYVFNIDRQHPDNKFVVVCEGPFDAMSIDGVAVLGNQVSEARADMIDALGKDVIVVPDTDVAGIALIDAALEYGWGVSFPIWQETCKDINAAVVMYGKLFTLACILDSVEYSSLKINLKKRTYGNKTNN